MKDGLLRRGLKVLALGFFFVTHGLDRAIVRVVAPSRRPFLLGGDCRRCGACCEAPAIRVGWVTWHLPTWRRVFLAWQERVNGFVLTERDRAARTFVFRCTHFDASTRRCDSYASRPGMCRDYPRVLLYQARPELLPGCGYRPVDRDGKRLLRVLSEQALTDEQKERLKERLFLE